MDPARIGVIFDCDGTLVDSMGVWWELENELARRANATLTPEQCDHITTLTLPECSTFFHEQFGLCDSAADVLALINDYMLDFYSHKAKAKPGTLRFVADLVEAGAHASIASSTPGPCLVAAMESCGFSPYLDAIVSVDDVGKSKREPDVYHRARAAMGTEIANTWGAEDAIYAVRTLKAAGYKVIGVYDNDLSATKAQLAEACDVVADGFADLDAKTFLRNGA